MEETNKTNNVVGTNILLGFVCFMVDSFIFTEECDGIVSVVVASARVGLQTMNSYVVVVWNKTAVVR